MEKLLSRLDVTMTKETRAFKTSGQDCSRKYAHNGQYQPHKLKKIRQEMMSLWMANESK